jgi:alpha-1,6-mannosyltransferase
MSVHTPLGATASNGTLELTGAPWRSAQAPSISRRGSFALLGLLVCGLTVALAAASTDQLLPQSVRPVPGALAGALRSGSFDLGRDGLVAVLIAMFGCYAVALQMAERLPARAVIATIVALDAVLLLAPPLLSTDIFSYQAYGRMWANYGVNPYFHGPETIALDPLYPYVGAKWVGAPTVYGPVFTLLSGLLAPASIAAGVLAFKALAVAATLGTVALLWRSALLRGLNPVRSAALFGLNPLVAVYGIGGGHNDLLMVCALSAAVYALLAQREHEGGALIVLAVGVKLTAGLVLPFALAAPSSDGSRRRERRGRRIAVGTLAALALIALVSTATFGAGPLHLPTLLERSQSSGDWHSIPGLISIKLGLGSLGHGAGIALGVAFAGTCAWLLRAVWRGTLDWIDGAGWATLALLVTASSLLPWYVVWLLPLAGLSRDRRLWRAALILTGVVQALQLIDYVPHGASSLGL